MLSDLGRKSRRYTDLDAPMSGVCQTCKTVVECKRRDCAVSAGPANAPDPAVWSDLLSTECPECKRNSKADPPVGARVFVMERPALAPLITDPPQPGVVR